MQNLSITFVEGWHLRPAIHLGQIMWSFAVEQRYFGPRQLMVATARANRIMIGLAHCDRTDPPMMGLKCCLAALDDGAALAVAFSDEAVTAERPVDLDERWAAATEAAEEFGVELVDWIMCDDLVYRSMRQSVT